MKKILLLAMGAALLCSTQLKAQERKAVDRVVRLGIDGGANLGKISGQGFDEAYNLGYFLGGFVQVNVTKMIGVQGEANFTSGTVKTSNNFNDIYTTVEPN